MFLFALTLFVHIFLPIVDALLGPLLHEARISLQLVYLNPAHFLLLERIIVYVLLIELLGDFCLLVHFICELLHMNFQVNIFLRTIQLSEALLKEGVCYFVVLGL